MFTYSVSIFFEKENSNNVRLDYLTLFSYHNSVLEKRNFYQILRIQIFGKKESKMNFIFYKENFCFY
jgi:hypothetical protein